MTGGENQRLRVLAVCVQRDSGVGGAGGRGGDAEDDFEGDAVLGEGFDLLATAPENEGIAAFEPDYPLASTSR